MNKPKIFIDPGHNYYKYDTGAQGNGLKEQDVTFEIGIRLKKLLSDVGFNVKISRETKETNLGTTLNSSLAKRVSLAESFKADYFISLHCNAASALSANGTETYIYSNSSKSKPLATLINNNICKDLGTFNRGVKEISKRDGVTAEKGREIKVGKLKSATSKRDVPLNDTAIEMILDLRKEFYYGEDSPLIPDENGNFTRPVNFRKRYYRILKVAGIETKGLHSLRHTFATNLVNGIKQPDGSIKSLTPRQVADLLGHTTSEITELYYVKRDLTKLNGITDGFEL